MKNFYLFVGIIFTLFSCNNLPKKGININFKNIKEKELIIFYDDIKGERKRLDLKTENDKIYFIIKDSINYLTEVTVVIKGFTKKSRKDYIETTLIKFFTSPNADVSVNVENIDGVLNYNITDNLGDNVNKDWMSYNNEYNLLTKDYREVIHELEKMREEVTPKDTTKSTKELTIEANKILKKDSNYVKLMEKSFSLNNGSDFTKQYITNNNNVVSLSKLYYMYLNLGVTDSTVKELLPKYPEELKSNHFYIKIKDRLELREKVIVGSFIKDLRGKLINGEDFNFSSILGKKYILLDFWGTWCMPCVKGMPDMKKFYDKNKSKLEIISVSCNDKLNKWEEFLGKHKEYNWTHVFDSYNENINLFSIDAFPTKLIMDLEGKVVYRRASERHSDYEDMQKILDGKDNSKNKSTPNKKKHKK